MIIVLKVDFKAIKRQTGYNIKYVHMYKTLLKLNGYMNVSESNITA